MKTIIFSVLLIICSSIMIYGVDKNQISEGPFTKMGAIAAVISTVITLVGILLGIIKLRRHKEKSALQNTDPKLEIIPRDQNIFHVYEDIDFGGLERKFYIHLHFHLRTNIDLDILNIDLKYDEGYWINEKKIYLDGNSVNIDNSWRFLKPFRLNQNTDFIGLDIFERQQNGKNQSLKDYGNVEIEFELISPVTGKKIIKNVAFKLQTGGRLVPNDNQFISLLKD